MARTFLGSAPRPARSGRSRAPRRYRNRRRGRRRGFPGRAPSVSVPRVLGGVHRAPCLPGGRRAPVSRLLDPRDGEGSAAHAALQRLTALLARRGMVVLISDLLFDRELALVALRYLRHRGHQVVVFHLMAPAEVELSGPPEVRFKDPESAVSVVVRPRELARAYADTVRREVAAWRKACRRHGVAYHHVQTDMPFGLALRLLT